MMKYPSCFALQCLLLLAGLSSAIATIEQTRLEWNRKTLAGDYLRIGKRSPKWDSHATNAFEAFAKLRAARSGPDTNVWRQFSESLSAAVAAGCDDPLIRYLQQQFLANDEQRDTQSSANERRSVADAVLTRGYSPVRRYYACMRAAAALKAAMPSGGSNPPDMNRLRQAGFTNIIAMLQDKPTTPVEEAFDAFWELMERLDANPGQFKRYCLTAEKIISERWPTEPLAWYARGDMYIRYAWDGRGTEFADKVTGEQWKEFEERLPEAEKALQRAWELDPKDGRIPARMITVMRGLNKPRTEMEKWFDRAMKANTDNYPACRRKRYYLEPKWHGSAEEMLAFGRECVKSTNWGGRVPLILVDTHEALAKYLPKEKRTNYWATSPEIWRDAKASFEKFFQLNPDEIGFRHN